MKGLRTFGALCFCAWLFAFNQVNACTAFQLQSQDGARIYCRSLEFGFTLDSNLLIVPRGTEFTGTAPNKQPGLRWNVKYGHVGMNQSIAKTLVSDGMNEKGLIVGALYLPGYAQYEKADNSTNNRTIGSWEVISFLLATCATVDEVKKALSNTVVAQEPFLLPNFVLPLHYYVTDSSGSTIIVEYVNGKRNVYESHLGILTNSPPFDWQQINLSNYVNLSPINVPQLNLQKFEVQSFGQGSGLLGLPGDYTPPSRFVRAALYSKWAFPGKSAEDTVNLGFHILNTFDIFSGIIRTPNNDANLSPEAKKSMHAENTEWVVVHDRTNLKTYFRSYESLAIQMVDLKKIDFAQPGFRQVALRKDFAVDDATASAKPL